MTGSPADFHCLQRRLRLSGILTTRTALRIGSGGGGDLDSADLPVLKDVYGYPFVPGASLKGALRSTIEALVRGAHSPALEQVGIWSCDPLAAKDEGITRKGCGHHEAKQRREAAARVHEHCAVCRLLGSQVLASHVRFCDALAIRPAGDPNDHPIPIEIRDGVAIDRDLKTVYKAQKYDFEVVSPGTSFALEVFVDNPQDWLMGLLAMGFSQLAEGFTALGGFASRGLGRVDIIWSSLGEVAAEDLLEGHEPKLLQGPDLHTRQRVWQDALAERTRAAHAAAPGGH